MKYDCLIVDLDGTVYCGSRPVNDAVEALSRWPSEVVYLTNNAARSPEEVALKLSAMSFDASPDNVLTSAQLGAELLQDLCPVGSEILVLGAPSLRSLITQAGYRVVATESPDTSAVIQGHNEQTGWTELSSAARAIRNGAQYIATNRDTSLPSEDGLNVGNGAMVAAVEVSTGITAQSAGKPSPRSVLKAAARVDAKRPLVIGDRLDTDIQGAVSAGCDSLCVLTGVTSVADICAAPPSQRPTYIMRTLADLDDITWWGEHLRLDSMTQEEAQELTHLELVDENTVLAHFPCTRDISSRAVAARIAGTVSQAWHNEWCITSIQPATANDAEELGRWAISE